METKISILENDSALADVKLSELLDVLTELKDINIESANRTLTNGKIYRFGVLEFLATFATSAAAYQLASALRDFVKRQSVDIKLKSPEGDDFIISAKSGDPNSLSDVVGFIMKQHTKESKAFSPHGSKKTMKKKKK